MGGCNLIYLAKSLLQKSLASHIQSERDNSRDWNTQLAKSLFKLNLASLYSPNLILRDLLENIFLSCSAHLVLSVLSLIFLSVLSLLLPIGLATHFCKGPSSTSVKTLFNISTQPQLLEVEGSGDVGIVKTELRYILCSYLSLLFFSHFFDCYILVRIELI
jgi:hypothetical protein